MQDSSTMLCRQRATGEHAKHSHLKNKVGYGLEPNLKSRALDALEVSLTPYPAHTEIMTNDEDDDAHRDHLN